jgi:hypothetical protein
MSKLIKATMSKSGQQKLETARRKFYEQEQNRLYNSKKVDWSSFYKKGK